MQQPTTPGWYPDPWAPGHQRWFDGSAWTTHAFRDQPGDAPTAGTQPTDVLPTDVLPTVATPPPPPDWVAPTVAIPPPPAWSPAADAPAGAVTPARLAKAHAALVVIAAFVVALVGTVVATTRASHGAAAPTTPRTPTPPTTTAPPSTAPTTTAPTTTAPTATAPTTTAPTTAPTSTPPVGGAAGGAAPGGSTSAAAAVLPDLVLQPSDVDAGIDVAAIPGGDSTSAGATLDLCNGSFPSESLRVARLQDAATDSSGDALVSTEAVAYASSAATSQALRELRAVAAACPSTPVTSPVGEPTVTTVVGAAPDGGWPQVAGVDRLAFALTTTDSSGATTHSIAVYLRRGPLIVGVYLPQTATPTPAVDGQTTPAGIAGVFAGRLAALPAATVAG